MTLSTIKGNITYITRNKICYTKVMKKIHNSLSLNYNTPISVFEKEQGISLGVPAKMKLGDYIKKSGFPSLAEMMRK